MSAASLAPIFFSYWLHSQQWFVFRTCWGRCTFINAGALPFCFRLPAYRTTAFFTMPEKGQDRSTRPAAFPQQAWSRQAAIPQTCQQNKNNNKLKNKAKTRVLHFNRFSKGTRPAAFPQQALSQQAAFPPAAPAKQKIKTRFKNNAKTGILHFHRFSTVFCVFFRFQAPLRFHLHFT